MGKKVAALKWPFFKMSGTHRYGFANVKLIA